jgi:RNA polymerase sigma factor (sigma-70 family)
MSDARLTELRAARETFASLIETVRPELLRYCARMMGSTIDGEDVVQEALARAFYDLARLRELGALRPWLFRIAHNCATNALVARGRRSADSPLSEMGDVVAAEGLPPDAALEQRESVTLAIGRFLELAPAQRACVILKDVLDLSLEEIARVLDVSVPGVKAALHRGRVRLRELADDAPSPSHREHTPELVRYVMLFNARDWDGVRTTLARDVELDLVGHSKRRGVQKVGTYFTNYSRLTSWHLAPAWMDGREVIAVCRGSLDARPTYVIELSIVEGRIAAIRDFVHATHVVDEATFERESKKNSTTTVAIV